MTLNQIVEDIILTCTYASPDCTDKLYRRQIESWIHAYRLLLLKQEVSRNSTVDPTYISYMRFSFRNELKYKLDDQLSNIPLVQTMGSYTGAIPYVSNEELPQLAPLPGRVGIVTAIAYNYLKRDENDLPDPKNIPGVPIPIEDISRSYWGAYSKWGGERMSLSIYDGRLILFKYGEEIPFIRDGASESGSLFVDANRAYVMCGLILANPEAYPDNHTVLAGEEQIPWRDTEYPMPDDRVPRLKQMIYTNELSWVFPQQQQNAQMAKQEEQEIQSNPQAVLQTGTDLYGDMKL